MMERYCFSCQVLRQPVFWVLGLLLLGGLAGVSAGDIQYSVEAPGYRSIPLAHISPQLAQQMLDPLHLATVSPVPGSNKVMVTGESNPVRKVAAILELIDSTELYEIRELRAGSSLRVLPSNNEIANSMGRITIGTFNNPPRYTNKAKAIIDIVDTVKGTVWAIAPAVRMADIAAALDAGPQTSNQLKTASGRITEGTILPELQPFESRFPGDRKLNPAFNADGRPMIASAGPQVSPSMMGRAEMVALAQVAPGPQTDGNTPEPVASSAIPVTPESRAERISQGAAEPNQIAAAPRGTDPRRAAAMAARNNTAAPSTPAAGREEPLMTVDDLPDPECLLDVTLPDKLPVIQLIDYVSKYLKLDCLYEPQDVTGEVTVKLNGDLHGKIKVKDLYHLLESVLRLKGLVMTRHSGNMVTIVKKENVHDGDPNIVDDKDTAAMPGDVVVIRVFKLEHIDTTSAKNLLEGMRVSMDVKAVDETNTIIVTAYAFRMPRIQQLLSIVDKAGEARDFRYRQLRYTMAKALAEKVKTAAEQLQPGSVIIGEPEPAVTVQRLPTDTEATYQAKVRALAQQQAAQRAAAGQARPGQPRPDAKGSVYLDADERTNRILMIGAAKQLERVEDLIDSLDIEQQNLREFKPYQMKHVDAQDVAKKLAELGIISKAPESQASQRLTSTPTTPRTSSQPMTAEERRLRDLADQVRANAGLPANIPGGAEPGAQGLIEEPQVIVIEATNSLLVNATPEQHVMIQKIINFVDAEMVEDDIPYKVYSLENSSPDHLAEVLRSMIQETTQSRDKDGKIVDTTTIRRVQDEVYIASDPNTYSLIVFGNKKNQEWIANLIEKLDKRRPQVLIDVTLVEITNSQTFDYDLNIVESLPDLMNQSGLMGTLAGSGSSVVTSSDLMSNLSKSGRSHYADMQSYGGKFQGFYGDKHINFLLTAMETKSYGRVLAKPKILVNDNENGIIQTQDVTYVEKSTSVPVSTGNAGNNGTLVTTSTDYSEYTAGIRLDIIPHISEGDLLQLKASLTRSDFLPTTDATKPPNKTESEVNTNVTVPDGSTIILGGMLKLNQTKGTAKVPLLGDLPLVGGLFRSISNTNNESKLYVFVKAEIIRPATLAKGMDDLKNLSDRNREAFEGYEKEFQDYQSWPGLKDQIIEPKNVLDAQ